jgi:peptidyl-prolyl cis-trans isomerase D
MFDLFRSRDKAVRILLGGILVVVSFSMLTYLIPSFNNGSADPSDMVVADVGKDPLTLPEVTEQIQRILKGQQLPANVLSRYIPQVVDEMLMTRALAYEAGRLGYQVSDAELSAAIRQILPNLFPDGKFLGRDAYVAALSQQNLKPEDFETALRREMLATRLRDVALEGTVVTQSEIEQEYRRKYEKVKVEYVKLTAEKYKAESQPSADDLQAYFKASATTYVVPEKRNLIILLADQAKLEESLKPADAELQVAYNQNRDAFRTPERVRVRHILLKTTDKPPADEPKIKAQAEDLLKQIRGGANFSELAKKYSEDTASANNAKDPGELPDWIARQQTVPEFESVAFSQKVGQTSDLVKTQYGYHIIQVLEHQEARLRPFEEVKADLAAQWKKQRANDIVGNISDKAQAALQKDPTHPEKVAAEYSMQVVKADGVAPEQAYPEIGVNGDFDQSVSGLKVAEVSQPVGLPGNKIALAVVTGIVPARPNTFDEVKDQIRDKIIQNRSAAALQRHAQELIEAAKKSGDLIKSAKAMGLEGKTTPEFERSGTVEGIGPASYLQDAFERPDGSVIGPVNTPDATVVARVVQRVPAGMEKFAAERGTLREEIKKRKSQDRNTLFGEGLRQMLIQQGKIKMHEAVIKRLIASYATAS